MRPSRHQRSAWRPSPDFATPERLLAEVAEPEAEAEAGMDGVEQIEGRQCRQIAIRVAAQHAVVEAEHVEADHEVGRRELREQGLDLGLAEGREALARGCPR